MAEYRTITKETFRLARVSQTFKIMEYVLALIALMASAFQVSVVVFLRKNFGERYLSLPSLYVGYSVVWVFAFMAGILGRGHSIVSPPMVLCYLMFVAAGIFHRWWISERNKAAIRWHSFNPGQSFLYDIAEESWDFKYMFKSVLNDDAIMKWIEPALVFGLGGLVVAFCPAVGIWLIISGLSLAVRAQIDFYYERQEVLDLQDSQIAAEHYGDLMEGKPARETAGLTMAESNLRTINSDPGLQAAFANLGKEMKALVTPPSRIINPYDEPMVTLR